ncbi:peptidoglycan-binding protein [Streptomyces sp. NPDC052095]|uniref:peptidoglycan-binding domain-containing protein n=1 Tax=unclassified Streptomyces TaxID=2593676 RepID=UPI00344D5ABF
MSASRENGQGVRPADLELFESADAFESIGPVDSFGSANPTSPVDPVDSFGPFEEKTPVPGIPSPSSRRSLPSRPAPADRRSARRSTRGRKQSPALLIGTVTVGVGVAITVSLVCDAFTARRSDFVAPISTNLSSQDAVTPPSPSAPPTSTARPPRAQAPGTRATATTPPPATSSTAPSATRPAAPSTPAGPPANRPSPPRDRTRTTDRPGLSLGSTGREVEDLQRRLQQLQLYLGSADGNFTADVGTALSRFQKARNIPEEPGVYGPLTRAALRAETESADRNSHRNGDSASHGRPDRHGESGRYGDAYPYR